MDLGGAPLGAGRPVEGMDSSCQVPDSARGRSPVGPGHDFYRDGQSAFFQFHLYHASAGNMHSSGTQTVRIEALLAADYKPNAADMAEMTIGHGFVRTVIVSRSFWGALGVWRQTWRLILLLRRPSS